MNILLIVLFFIIYGIGIFVGWFIAEKHHPQMGSILDFYPFICRKCLTTWTLAALYIVAAIIVENWWFGGAGILITALTAIAMWYTDKERMDEEAIRIKTRL